MEQALQPLAMNYNTSRITQTCVATQTINKCRVINALYLTSSECVNHSINKYRMRYNHIINVVTRCFAKGQAVRFDVQPYSGLAAWYSHKGSHFLFRLSLTSVACDSYNSSSVDNMLSTICPHELGHATRLSRYHQWCLV